jgi:hypothetical protein
LNVEYAVGVSTLFGVAKLVICRSADLAISPDRCSNTYLPLVVVSLIVVVFVVLTTPFTRNATTPTISRQATPSPTTISTIVNPKGSFRRRTPPPRPPELSAGEIMEPT